MQAFWIVLASLLFATMSLLVKLAADQFSIVQIIFFRALPGALLLAAYARLRGLSLLPVLWRAHLLRSLAGVASMSLSFYATSKLALGTASTLEYTAPIFMALYVAIVTRQRPSRVVLLALLVGFAGVLLLLRPSLQRDQLAPFLAGLAGGALSAVAYLQIVRLTAAGELTWRIVLIFSVTTAVLSAILMLFSAAAVYTPLGVATLAGIGGAGLAGQFAMTRAFRGGVPTLTAALQYTTIVFATIYGYFVWGDRPTWLSAMGLVLIVTSGLAAAFAMRGRRLPYRIDRSRGSAHTD
jgi:S-adenosylmethionine uptake transporter